MARRGIVPDRVELIEVLLDLSKEFYGDTWGPGITFFNTHKPLRWAEAATLSRHFKPGNDPNAAPNWAATVEDLIKRKVAPPNSVVRNQPRYKEPVDKKRVIWMDDDTAREGYEYSSSYVVNANGREETHYVLR